MASAAVVARRTPREDRERCREDRDRSCETGRVAPPWRAELDELGALLAESRGDCRPGDALRDRIAAIVAEEAGDRLSESLVRRIADRTVRALG